MDSQKIKILTEEWEAVTEKVLKFENPGLSKIRGLFKETFDLLDRYRESDFVPKQINGLIFKIHDFCWWVSSSEETPLHSNYREIVDIVYGLNTYFLTPVSNSEKILKTIDKIV